MVPLRVYFCFYPNNKGELSNVEEDIWKISIKKAPVESANAANLNQHLPTHHPTALNY